MSPWPLSTQPSTTPTVCRDAHTTALWIGRPVSFSHTMPVSRWLVSATADRSDGWSFAFRRAARITSSWTLRISIGSCSIQPARG